ncbi:MAG: T9SS type A sorting domain-containing protein, partial [Bacteroidota bacterium]
LETSQHVRIRVFDITGSLVETMTDTWQQPGEYNFRFKSGSKAGGMYFILFESDNQSGMIKVADTGQPE